MNGVGGRGNNGGGGSGCRSLYQLSLTTTTEQFELLKRHLVFLPEEVLFDVYYQLYESQKLCLLGMELSDLNILFRMLRLTTKRTKLLKSFQALMDHGTKIGNEIAVSYKLCCAGSKENSSSHDKIINLGLRLGKFLNDAGWYAEGEQVLSACKNICVMGPETPDSWCRTLDCCHKLLHAQTAYSLFDEASETRDLALQTIEKLKNSGYTNVNHAALYSQFGVLYFSRCEYDQAYKWSMEALKELKPHLPKYIIVNVLRQTAKSCIMKREYKKAGLLIKQAVFLAKEIYDPNHPKYSDVLIDYGFYLLNSDNISNSVSVYTFSLEIRRRIFGKYNLQVAMAHEDLAYALYVQEYSSGKFSSANHHINKAIDIMEKLIPSEHLMLASAKRVKALILEEIALDNSPTPRSDSNLFIKSEALHLSALQLSKNAFGDTNVQTAKHYGNLGRLYQSMHRYDEAEAMHLRAIKIKEDLLGPDDYEVGLSVGHLASLYNFHMVRYEEAEKLYHRSIEISLKLFGKSYSGLEYDYRGLLHVYSKLGVYPKYVEYMEKLSKWKNLRDEHANSDEPLFDEKCPQTLEELIGKFFPIKLS